jgi:SNF2 family DNA or RNA helicase
MAPSKSEGDSSSVQRDRQIVAERIGDYAILRPLQVGGFGATYLTEKDGRKSVLKHLTLDREEFVAVSQEMFLRECKSLASLDQRGLPRVVDYFIRDRELFLILDYQEGTSLWEFVYPETAQGILPPQGRRTQPALERVIHWSIQLAEMLCYLHDQKPFPILHRNLSPLSIQIVPSIEEVRLVDCGLLNSYRTLATLTGYGSAAFVPNPFAIPNLMGEPWSQTYADIYAFGRILDFMLTGNIPTEAGAPPALPTTESSLDVELHTLLARIIMRCWDLSLHDRYESMAEVMEDLTGLRAEAGGSESQRIPCACGHLNRPSARFCERCGQLTNQDGQATESVEANVPIIVTYDTDAQTKLINRYHQGHFAPLHRFRMREVLDAVQSDPGFDELISLESLPLITKLPHQREAALRALRQMRGRALLADEVGLGKTIEAGLVLKELILRRLATRILIFCPVQLLGQWQSELYEKFEEIFLVMGKDIDTSLAWYCPRLIAPYEVARQRFYVEEMLRHRYDLVVLDEAHYLNYPDNERILRAMKNLQKKYFLLLSATPMHNSLDELYNIITLLRPGHFEDLKTFHKRFVDPEDPTRPLDTEIEVLRNSLREVMVRNIRRQVMQDYPFPERDANTVLLALDPKATKFYLDFRDFYKRSLSKVRNRHFLMRMGEIVERLCSSSEAFSELINRLKRDRYVQQQLGQEFIRRLEHFAVEYPSSLVEPKIRTTAEILQRLTDQGERVLVFSQFNDTARYIYRRISQTNLRERCMLYDEQNPLELRLKSLRDFRDSNAGILFCPGEASEGLNLQFASVMINFDLPWDPMKLEQRIGRIQRIGGRQKIRIYNLVLKDTIEEEILKICQDKIEMFGKVIGQVEEILGNLREEDDFSTMICKLFLERQEEDENGKISSAEEHLELALTEAVERSSGDQETNAVNMIYFDFSETDDNE